MWLHQETSDNKTTNNHFVVDMSEKYYCTCLSFHNHGAVLLHHGTSVMELLTSISPQISAVISRGNSDADASQLRLLCAAQTTHKSSWEAA